MTIDIPTRQERIAEQTEVRRALLHNGYVPLANKSKLCVLKNWPRIEVTDELVEGWADTGYQATGVRIEGALVALDFDIDSPAALDAIWDALPDDLFDPVDQMPVRRGGGQKVCLFCRVPKGVMVENIWSKAFYPPGTSVEGMDGVPAQRLEIFGAGGGARQIGVYGAHTVEGGKVLVSYAWVGGRGLADAPLSALPELTVAQLERLADVVSSVLLATGWVYEVRALDGRVAAAREYALDGSERFDIHGGADGVGLGELESLARDWDGLRVSMSWKEGLSAANRTRGLVSINPGDDRVQIWDSMTGVLYRPAGLDLRGKVTALGEALGRASAGAGDGAGEGGGGGAGVSRLEQLAGSVPAERRMFGQSAGDAGGAGDAPDDGSDACDAALKSLVDGWAWVTIGGGFAAPLGGTADQMMTLGGLKNTMAPWVRVEMRKRSVVEVNPADLWLKHPQRKMVAGHRLIPWSIERVAEDEQGQAWLNTYEPPRHGGEVLDASEADQAVADWLQFLTHLIPDARERAWFEMWLAGKVQKPWVPNCGVVMVAETHGTGRGTLFDMLMAVMGERHVKPITSTELMGGSGQGQYTDWLADSLLVVCDELLAGNDAGGAMEWKRREVYERLKSFVDPRVRRVRIVRKGLPGYDTEVYASFLLATNNPNALPLAEQDRRFAVIRNTCHMLAATDVHAAITRWRQADERFNSAFGAAVWRRLSGLAVDWAALRDAPDWMEGRQDMLAANESALDEILAGVLADVPGDYLLGDHLRERIRISLQASGMEGEIKNWWMRAQDLLSRRNSTGWRRMARRQDAQPRAAGRKFVSVFYRVAGDGETGWSAMTLDQRAEAWRRGADVNDRLSKLDAKVRERGLKIIE